jgi:hypothetical protein
MEEATNDKQSSTSGSKRKKQQTQQTHGWIRMHSDETMISPQVEEPLDTEAQPSERKGRKESEKPKEPGQTLE